MVETIIVEFRILKDALVNGLTHPSISDKAVVAAIAHPEEGISGFSLNNALNNAGDTFEMMEEERGRFGNLK